MRDPRGNLPDLSVWQEEYLDGTKVWCVAFHRGCSHTNSHVSLKSALHLSGITLHDDEIAELMIKKLFNKESDV